MRKKKWIAIFLVLTLLVGMMPQNLHAQEGAEAVTESIMETLEDTEEAPSTEAPEDTEETPSTGALEDTEETPSTEAPEDTEETPSTEAPEDTEEAPYISLLEVYQSARGTEGTRELTRHEELDEEFGATVYTVDYGSTWSSINFYLSARLSESAPEDAVITMSAYDLSGTEKSVKINPSTEEKINRQRINGSIFAAGANGGQRAIYTITVGNEEKTQVYKIIVNRVMELSSLSGYVEDELTSIINESYEKEIKNYTGTVSSEVSSIKVKAQQQLNSTAAMTINGSAYTSGEEMEIPIASNLTEVKIRMEQEGIYAGEPYAGKTYQSAGEYTLTVTRTKPVNVEFVTDPKDAIVCVYDAKGERIYPSGTNEHFFEKLLEGSKYTYQITAYGYKALSGSFAAEPEMKIEVELDSATYKHPELTNNEWWNYRNNEENNGLTDVSTPENAEEVSQKWAVQISGDWSSSFTPPIILGGYIYTSAGKFIYKMDKDTGEILAVSEEAKGSMGFALNPLTYAEGMIFAQVGSGQIQAFSATTLESLWISEAVGGQTLSPITYKNGYIYTGTWNSETDPGVYFCLSVTDEDPNSKTETKACTWKFSHKGGFYWAGSYASDKYVVFGSDDGSKEGNYTDNSILYSVTAKDGILIDKIEGLSGDIRTSVVYADGYVYVATKGGFLYRVKMNADGTFGRMDSYELGGMATASPVVYKNRIYIGVCGQGGQFNADGAHHFAVLNETAEGLSLAYTIPIKGYPQAVALVSTAYEHVDYDGNGKADGRVYVYFTYNAFPGGIVGFTDTPGQTSAQLDTFFEPEPDQQQYCISPICVDKDGTLYYKNDSNYLMAVESNPAYLNDAKVEAADGAVSWDAEFKKSKLEYKLKVSDATKQVTITLDIPEGRTVTINGQPYTGSYELNLDTSGNGTASIKVSYENKSKTYVLEVTRLEKNAALSDLFVSGSNNFNDTDEYVTINPAFSPIVQNYVTEVYGGTRKFLNVYAKTDSEGATMEMEAVSGVEKINRANSAAGSDGNVRFSVYFGEQESTAVVNIKVTAADGVAVQNYKLTLLRTDTYAPVLKDMYLTRISEDEAVIEFTANEQGQYYYKMVETGADAPEFSKNQLGTALVQGNNQFRLENLNGKGKDIYIITMDAYGNQSAEPVKVEMKPYKEFTAKITVEPEVPVSVTDKLGNVLTAADGYYTLVDGNAYDVAASADGFADLLETFVADSTAAKYSFTMKSVLSSNADLLGLYASSSDKFGAGVLKWTPRFDKNETNYTAVYGKERSYLNLWMEAEDEKATITLFAVSGIKSSTVNKDETITPEPEVEGKDNWKIYFAKGAAVAKVRVHVTAEDGSTKDYFVTLTIEDHTAPVLKKVSASRISPEKASVVFKTSENGTYYYTVVDKGAKAPVISRKEGHDVLEGTVIITLSGLTKGEKEVHIVLVDTSGNESEVLVLEVPDSRGYTGKGQAGGSATSGKLAGAGKKPTLVKKSGKTDKGDKNNSSENNALNHSGGGTNAEGVYTESGLAGGNGNESGWKIEGLDMSDPVNLGASVFAGFGLFYLMFWQYASQKRKKEKRKSDAM